MNEFRDAIANVIDNDNAVDYHSSQAVRRKAAEAVLDMPEMQALRTFLDLEFRTYNVSPSRSRALMINEGIPANVADWVLS